MKKISLYLIALLAIVAFTACNGDFDDWADPQTNPQEDPKEFSFQVSAVAGTIDLNTTTVDSIGMIKIDQVTIEEDGSVQYEIYVGVDDEFTSQMVIPFVVDNNQIKVDVYDLEDAIWALYGKEGKANDVKLRVYAIVKTANGQATKLKADDVSITIITKTLSIEDNYYMVGTANGWEQTGVIPFTNLGGGIFELIINLTNEKSYFKIIPQSGLDDLSKFWSSALGSAKNDDDSKTGTLVYQREGGAEPGAMLINGAGEVKIRLDMNNYTYKIGPKFELPDNMYITGSPWSWELLTGGNREMVRINGVNGFWTLYYLDADSQIKFFPLNTSWNNGIGYPEVTIPAESVNLAGLANDGGNIKNATAGWYVLVLIADEDGAYTIQYLEPKVWLIGNTSKGTWSNIATDPDDLFTVPATGTGEFVSPAFLTDGDLRMAVVIPGIDWWRTEFNIYSGSIVYRADGNDQAAVSVLAGKKAYLNLIDNIGRIE